MKTGVIIQASMSSQRLPGKVLRDLCGKPLLQYVLESVSQCVSLDDVVVATSDDPSDDPLPAFCREQNVRCHRGSLTNVASRFVDIIGQTGWDAMVRLCGDSPLLDHRLIQHVIAIGVEGPFDLITNLTPKTFPKGQTVELIRTQAFIEGYELFSESADYEHVTPYFYINDAQWRIKRFFNDRDLSNLRMDVDTQRDFEVITSVLERLSRPHWSYCHAELVDIYEQTLATKSSGRAA